MSAPHFFALGATHQTAPLAVREKLSLDAEAAAALHGELATVAGLREFALLSTCNRIEFYGVAETADAAARVEAAFCARQKFSVGEFEKFRLSLRDLAAVRHLFEVAAGLDSQMLGETEIFGQVKDAYAGAQAQGSAGPVLNRVFQKTFQAAKFARTHTAITEGRVSVANVAVDLALNIFGGLAEARILLLGAGEIGEKTARAFQSRGAGALTVASRRLERAMELATQLGGSALPFEQREARLADFDVVVGSTAAPDLVVSRAAVVAALRRRPARPLFFIDLALPRDIDPAVAALENVFLYNLDDLAKIAEQNRAAREAEIEKCRALLGTRAEALWRQVEGRIGVCSQADEAPNRPANLSSDEISSA
ncbi:MAG TPA: glutamyl-tRNA reductase [Opitutaceae bacterium]|nr:glutamyl-tRNA reductase [Opitutaceae bacterium]